MKDTDIYVLKDEFIPGRRVLLHKMNGEPQMADGLQGTVTSVDDMGQIHVNWDNGSSLALNAGEDVFEIIYEPERLQILLIEPGKYPQVIMIDDDLEAMEDLVGGHYEEYCPFDDDVAIVCNNEGIVNGLPLNRAVYDPDNGDIVDIIAGNFFIVGTPEDAESYKSLTLEQQVKYSKMFRYPERFAASYGKIVVDKYKPAERDQNR